MPEWKPTTQEELLRAQAREKRVSAASGPRQRKPFLRAYRRTSFYWGTPTMRLNVIWDDVQEEEGEGLSYTKSTGVFTIYTRGLWEFDARVGLVNESGAYANTSWILNGTPTLGTGGGTLQNANTTHGGPLTRTLERGDTVAFSIQSNGLREGVPTTTEGQLTWLTARLLDY